MVFKRLNSATFKRVVMFFLAIFVVSMFLSGCGDKEVEKITLDKQSIELVAGETSVVKATVSPSDATNKTVTWSSDKPKVATVTNGTITAVGEGEAVITAKAGTKTATVTVKVSAKTFTVTFNSNGGSAVNNVTVKDGEKVTKPADPTLVGFNFGGWYSDAAFTTAFNFGATKITQNTTLYAKWLINKYSVVFESNGGTNVPEVEVEHNKKAEKPANPTKLGFDFAGWFTDVTLKNEFDFNTSVTGNVTLYAKWVTTVYEVTFNSNGGSDVTKLEVNFGGKATKPADPTKLGYSFGGWYQDEALTTAFDFNTVLSSDITLYAKWEQAVYTITFESNGGSLVESAQVNHGAKLTKPADPTLDNYVFVGWFKDAELTQAYDFDSVVEGPFKLYAKFDVDTTKVSNVEFVLNGGQFPLTTLDQFITSDPISTAKVHELNETAAEYYVSEGKGSYVSSLFLNDKSYKMSPSNWQSRAFLNRNAQGFFEVQLVKTDGSAAENQNPDLSLYEYVLFAHSAYSVGYNFVKSLQVGQIITITGFDITAIKEGTIDGTVNVYAANSNLAANKAVLSKDADLPVPTRANFTFMGWYATEDFSGEAVTKAANDGKVYAKWDANKVKLTFDSKGGSEVEALDVIYGQKPTQPQDPTKTGYIFEGWFVDAAYTTAFDFNADMLANTKVFAKWTAVEYDVVYHVNGGTEIETHKQAHDSKLAKPQDPTKEGSVLLGWYSDAEFANLYDFNTLVTGQVDLYAKWANKANVTVKYNAVYNETLKTFYIEVIVDGEALDATSIKFISEVRVANEFTAPNVLTPDTETVLWFGVAKENANPNYKQAGTYTYVVVKQDDTTYAFSFEYNPQLVTELPYEVSFVTNGGSEVTSQIIVKDQFATQPVDPTKVGYVFAGWFKDEALTEEFDFNTPITAITKVYAKWDAVKYTITYNLNGAKEFRYSSKDEMFVDFLTDLHEFLGSEADLNVFMHGEGKTSGFAGTWTADEIKNKVYEGPRPTEVNDQFFASHTKYMDKWLPFFDIMEQYTKAVNASQTFYNQKSTGIVRLPQFIQNTRPAYSALAPEGWVAPNHYTIETATFNLPVAVKNDMVFMGWYTNPEFTGEKVTKVTIGSTGNVVLYARFVTAIHTVEFNTNGGNTIAKVEIEDGNLLVQPVDPAKEGHIFDGWYSDAEFTTVYDFNTPVKGNVKLFAKWIDIPETIDVDLEFNGGSLDISNVDLFINAEPVSTHPLGIKNGNYWGGDYKGNVMLYTKGTTPVNANFSARIGINKTENGLYKIAEVTLSGLPIVTPLTEFDYVLVVAEDATTNKVNYDWAKELKVGQFITVTGVDLTTVPNGKINGTLNVYAAETVASTSKATFGYLAPITLVPSKADSIFVGWYDNAEFTGETVKVAGLKTTKIYAKYIPSKYTVTFNVDGGSSIANATVNYKGLLTQPADPKKAGFTFMGWYADEALTTAYDFNSEVTQNFTIFAKWQAVVQAEVRYNAVWNETRGTWYIEIVVPGEALDESSIKSISMIEQAGVVLENPTVLTPDLDTVMWFGVAKRDANLNLKAEGVYKYRVVRQDDSIYEFSFEYKSLNVTNVPEVKEVSTDYKAVLNETLGKYYIQYVVDGEALDESSIKSITMIKEAGQFVTPVVLTPDTDTSLWFGVADLTGLPTLKVAGLYAYEVVRQDDTVFVFEFDYDPAQVTDLPEVEEATVKYAAVWNETLGTWFIEVKVAEDLDETTVKAVTMLQEGNEFITPKALTVNTDKVLWFGVAQAAGDLAFKKAGKYLFEVTRQDDTKYMFMFEYVPASVTGIMHTVKFNENGGSDVADSEVEKGTVVAKPQDPTKAGYKFEGWFTDDKLTKAYNFEAQVTANIQLYAKWTLETYTITYNYNGGKLPYANKTEMLNDFLTDLYDFVKPTENLTTFMHGAGKTSGYAGLWYSNATYKNKIYAGPRPTEVNETLFISSSKYMDKWLPFFDMMETFVRVNPAQGFYATGTYTGFLRLNQYVTNTKPSTTYTDAMMNMMPDVFIQVNSFNINTEEFVLPRPVKGETKFLGWYNNAEFTGSPVTKITKGSTGNKVFYAKWDEKVEFEVTFDVDGVAKQVVESGKLATRPVDPTKEGFTFVGWFTDEALTVAFDFNTPITANVSLFAKWEEVTSEVEFETRTYDFSKAGASSSTPFEKLSTWEYNGFDRYTYGGSAFRGNGHSLTTKEDFGTISGKIDFTIKAGGNSGTQVLTITSLDASGNVLETKTITCLSITNEAQGLALDDQIVTFDNVDNNITAFKIEMVAKTVNTILYKVVIAQSK